MKYEFLEHTADVKFRSYGKTMEKAFQNSALALKETITDIEVEGREGEEVGVEGKDKEALLRNFLSEILYLLEGEGFLIKEVEEIEVERNEDYELRAKVVGDKAGNYDFTNPVKAVTYNDMEVKQEGNRWVCQVVLDV